MIHTIRLDRILQGAVATPYRDLVTRPTGAAVRGRVEDAMAEAHCLTALLDFSAVGLLDFSCADEIVAKLLQRSQSAGDRYVLLVGLSEDQSEAIDHVLTHHGMMCAVVTAIGEPPVLLGDCSNEVRAAFRHLHETGPCTTWSLSRDLGWSQSQAANALYQLTYNRLIQEDRETYRPLLLQ
jgi:hypothetical protein